MIKIVGCDNLSWKSGQILTKIAERRWKRAPPPRERGSAATGFACCPALWEQDGRKAPPPEYTTSGGYGATPARAPLKGSCRGCPLPSFPGPRPLSNIFIYSDLRAGDEPCLWHFCCSVCPLKRTRRLAASRQTTRNSQAQALASHPKLWGALHCPSRFF